MSKMDIWILTLIPIYIFYITFLGLIMFARRFKAVKNHKIKLSYFRSYQEESPQDLKVVQNHFSNQFEVPVLFMITCLAIAILHQGKPLLFILGVIFILLRMGHSFIHLGSNNVKHRALVYFTGIFVLLVMWVALLISY
ncbi:MAG: MAPEG family protein [Bdellovibrionales bacterium]|nr:MAPEG family protein [Bdellovibrionales bacterium]